MLFIPLTSFLGIEFGVVTVCPYQADLFKFSYLSQLTVKLAFLLIGKLLRYSVFSSLTNTYLSLMYNNHINATTCYCLDTTPSFIEGYKI